MANAVVPGQDVVSAITAREETSVSSLIISKEVYFVWIVRHCNLGLMKEHHEMNYYEREAHKKTVSAMSKKTLKS